MSLKLSVLPIVDIDNMASSLLALASVSVKPEVLKRIQTDQEEFKKKYCKEYISLTEIDTYAVEAKNIWVRNKLNLSPAWKRVGPYLVLFLSYSPTWQLALAGFGSFSAHEYIVRTGSSTWRVCNLFAIENDIKKETSQPPNTQLFYQKGLKELWQENWSAALTCFQKAIGKNPQDSNAWYQVGYCYRKLDRYQDAIEPFKQAIRIKPDYADAHCGLGVAYFILGSYQDAIESCKQAIRIKPDYADAHYLIGFNYLQVDDEGSALEEYKILKTLDTERANKLFSLIYQ